MNDAVAQASFTLLRNFRYWRSTLVVSVVCASFLVLKVASLAIQLQSDELGDSSSKVIQWLVGTFSPWVGLAILTIWAAIIAGISLGLFEWIFGFIFRRLIPVSILEEPLHNWGLWARLLAPVSAAEMATLQMRMQKSEPFRDLPAEGRTHAYKRFLVDMERARLGVELNDPRTAEEADKAYSDFRVCLGMAIFMPLLAVEIAGLFDAASSITAIGSLGLFLTFSVASWVTHKRALTLMVHIVAGAKGEAMSDYLTVNARAAMVDVPEGVETTPR
ncbi:hypothetical protein [Micrococcus luteus]|uniref:hypothetical protein n=1 Tax=Micrococcus luteus TaxID=1270 RepID=UPI001D0CDA03|nr:hypothetical protein [Micrococcus luteus]MCC0766255.1 hypothetical protein [Micrococcus luteus]